METELRGRALFVADVMRVVAFLQMAGVGLGGFLIVLGSSMPWFTFQDPLTGASGLTFTEGKITLALGLLVLVAAAARGLDRSSLQRWLTALVGCAAGITVATLARLKMIDIEGIEFLGLFFSGPLVGVGLRLTFAGGAIAAAMALLNLIPVPDRGEELKDAGLVEGVERGQG